MSFLYRAKYMHRRSALDCALLLEKEHSDPDIQQEDAQGWLAQEALPPKSDCWIFCSRVSAIVMIVNRARSRIFQPVYYLSAYKKLAYDPHLEDV